jgi:hypothetical protein
MQHATETHKQYQCRHIFTDGRRCASPCLRQEEFCYYHHTTRKPVANPKQRRSRSSTFHLPLPEDRSAIQASIGEVLQRIAANDIDPRRAGLLLYGLQIASLNLPKQQNTQRKARPEPVETVEEITIDPTLGVLAPRAEVETTKRKSTVGELLERMMLSDEAKTAAQEPATIPTLQATADRSDPHESPRRHNVRSNLELMVVGVTSRKRIDCRHVNVARGRSQRNSHRHPENFARQTRLEHSQSISSSQYSQRYSRTTSLPHIGYAECRAFPWEGRKEHLGLKNALLSNRRRIGRNSHMIHRKEQSAPFPSRHQLRLPPFRQVKCQPGPCARLPEDIKLRVIRKE